MSTRIIQATPLRVALVGAGWWGSGYARALTAREDATLCALVGHNPERTERRARQWGATAYTDIVAMLEAERPDLVCLSLPSEVNFEPTLQVIEAGIPLLAEKPLSLNLSEGKRLIAAAEARNLFFGINFNHRYAEPALRTKQAIEDGRLGEIVFAVWRFGGAWSHPNPHITLLESQCHGMDMLEWLCGPVISVMAEMTDKTGEGFRSLTLALRFQSGAIGTLIGSYDSSFNYVPAHYFEVNGTQGRTMAEDTTRRFTFQQAGSETREVWESGIFNDDARRFRLTLDRHLNAVITALRAGLPPPIPARAGLRARFIADAAIRSFTTGQRIMLNDLETAS